jgi:hypothetical protein
MTGPRITACGASTTVGDAAFAGAGAFPVTTAVGAGLTAATFDTDLVGFVSVFGALLLLLAVLVLAAFDVAVLTDFSLFFVSCLAAC